MWDEGNIEAVGAIGTLMIIFLLLVTLSLRMIGFGRGAAIPQSSH
jgi:hypothetical protein